MSFEIHRTDVKLGVTWLLWQLIQKQCPDSLIVQTSVLFNVNLGTIVVPIINYYDFRHPMGTM